MASGLGGMCEPDVGAGGVLVPGRRRALVQRRGRLRRSVDSGSAGIGRRRGQGGRRIAVLIGGGWVLLPPLAPVRTGSAGRRSGGVVVEGVNSAAGFALCKVGLVAEDVPIVGAVVLVAGCLAGLMLWTRFAELQILYDGIENLQSAMVVRISIPSMVASA